MAAAENTSEDRVVEDYYVELRRCKMLSAVEEKALFKAYRTCTKCHHHFREGDVEQHCPACQSPRNFRARDQLLEGALRFVVKVAKDYARRTKGCHYPPEYLSALISAGNLGVLVAVDRFNCRMGTRFLTYAAWWIREKILEELDGTGVVRVPTYRQKQLRTRRKQGESPEGDLANVQMEELAAADVCRSDESLEADLINTYGSEVILNALAQLDLRVRDRYIVLAYFGVREEPKNLRQLSARLSLSAERIRQVKEDVLDQLRDYLESHSVHESDDVFSD